jgi:hypothetical protein
MKEISLTQGKVALVDEELFDSLNQREWWYSERKSSHGRTGYAMANKLPWTRYNHKTELMHRVILAHYGVDYRGKDIDHIDGNGLNNQLSNLRVVSRSENNVNSDKPQNNTSGFKGVYPHSTADKWCAQIGVNGKRNYLGYFDTPIEAAKAYNDAALEHFGEFARLNVI